MPVRPGVRGDRGGRLGCLPAPYGRPCRRDQSGAGRSSCRSRDSGRCRRSTERAHGPRAGCGLVAGRARARCSRRPVRRRQRPLPCAGRPGQGRVALRDAIAARARRHCVRRQLHQRRRHRAPERRGGRRPGRSLHRGGNGAARAGDTARESLGARHGCGHRAGRLQRGRPRPRTPASSNQPTSVAVDAAGDLYIADTANCRVRVLPAATTTLFGQSMVPGRLYTVAGTGVCGTTGQGGPAAAARALEPRGRHDRLVR